MSKIIPKEELSGIESWSLPEVSLPAQREAAARPLTARQIEELQQQAREEGFQQGRREGLEAGRKEILARVHELESLMQTLARPLEQLDGQIEQELVSLALAVARQLVRRELKADPGQVLAVLREAMAALPVAARNVRLHLHPEDAALVREALALNDAERGWKIVEDPVLTRGGCKVSSDTSQIDASVERRLQTAIANVLGGERESDVE
jgi:flagellar assembly protein FliH